MGEKRHTMFVCWLTVHTLVTCVPFLSSASSQPIQCKQLFLVDLAGSDSKWLTAPHTAPRPNDLSFAAQLYRSIHWQGRRPNWPAFRQLIESLPAPEILSKYTAGRLLNLADHYWYSQAVPNRGETGPVPENAVLTISMKSKGDEQMPVPYKYDYQLRKSKNPADASLVAAAHLSVPPLEIAEFRFKDTNGQLITTSKRIYGGESHVAPLDEARKVVSDALLALAIAGETPAAVEFVHVHPTECIEFSGDRVGSLFLSAPVNAADIMWVKIMAQIFPNLEWSTSAVLGLTDTVKTTFDLSENKMGPQ